MFESGEAAAVGGVSEPIHSNACTSFEELDVDTFKFLFLSHLPNNYKAELSWISRFSQLSLTNRVNAR
jgi:hypothetical protein